MITVSAKAKYGLSAVYMIAQESRETPIQIREIAEKRCVPHVFLESILRDLKKAGILTSYRGATGGYQLAKDPEQILVSDVLKVCDGDVQFCGQKTDCDILNNFWQEAENMLKHQFQKTIADLLKDKAKKEKTLNFSI